MMQSVFYRILFVCIFFASLSSVKAGQSAECVRSFDSFAFFAADANRDSIQATLPSSPWQLAATIPPHGIEGYYEHYAFFTVALSRKINAQEEIWLQGIIYSKTGNSAIEMIIIYRPSSQKWEFIRDTGVGGSPFNVRGLFVDSTGSIWGRVTWKSGVSGAVYYGIDKFPVLAKFNETTRHFEYIKDVPQIPLVREIVDGKTTYYVSDHETRIELDNNGVFWLFIQHDGLYRYEIATETTTQVLNFSDAFIGNVTVAPDGSLYFTKVDSTIDTSKYFFRIVLGTLFQFVPKTNQLISIDMPKEEWPSFSGLMVDHDNRIWLGSIGYRDTNETWHLVHPDPQHFFDAVDQGYWSEVGGMPSPVLESSDGTIWFNKNVDSGHWIDGLAWYKPETGTGCEFTTYPGNIVEDANRTLWLLADGKLYSYLLNS